LSGYLLPADLIRLGVNHFVVNVLSILLSVELGADGIGQLPGSRSQFMAILVTHRCIEICSNVAWYQIFFDDKIDTVTFSYVQRSGIVYCKIVFIGASHLYRLPLPFYFTKFQKLAQYGAHGTRMR
jgi:hypothetical protein